MELKNYEFTRSVVFQGKFSAAPGDTLMQTAEELFVYSGRRGTQEVLLRVKTITTYLKEGWLKEVAGLDEPGEEPKKTEAVAPQVVEPVVAVVVPTPKPPVHVVDVTARIIPSPQIIEEAPLVPLKPKPKPDPIVIVPHPKPTPPVAIKKPEAPKPSPKPKTATKPTAKPTPAIKEVVAAKPEKVSPILEAALNGADEEAGIDAVLARTKKVVRKGR